jgi:hypothetical protein
MIEAGIIDGDSIHAHTGEVFKSFWQRPSEYIASQRQWRFYHTNEQPQ